MKIIHIEKESNNLGETEFLGVDSDSCEIYEDIEKLDVKLKSIAKDVLKLNLRDVKKIGISKQTLWNVKKRIKLNQCTKISTKIKVKLLTLFAHGIVPIII